MSAHSTLVLTCDKPACVETVRANVGESSQHLRARAHRDHGWRSWPSFAAGGHTDFCRFHS